VSQQWPDLSDAPTLAEALIAHGSLSASTTEVEAVIEYSNTKRLY
jgi:hypothetical protein